ncbi:MAG: NusG domain II-containing protein [Butyrivibrio sp.]|nr:NusG domain II-containing protein [Butyrivibrio sp.]
MKKDDMILIGVLLAGVAVILCALLLANRNGEYAVVSVDGVEVASFPLNSDTVYEIEGYNGGHNTLIIKDGKAHLEDSSCPDHLCEHMGRIDREGQSIICLPNRVVVEIQESGKNPVYDTISS